MHSLHGHPGNAQRGLNWSRINQWVLWLGLAAAVGWLYVRHNAHLLQLLPFLILLACPLMHVFGHGHGEHGSGGNAQGTPPRPAGRDDEGPRPGAGDGR